MVSVYDAHAGKLIKEVAARLKEIKEIAPPEWAKFVKTGVHKERPPQQKDWWYIRAAAILRSIYKNGPVGVSKLRSKYGGKQDRECRPEKFRKGSGAIIRKIIQQLEKAELIKHKKTGVHKGRVITPKGTSLLNKAAVKVVGEKS
ncbi:30S ribosomal protein S19e [Candidatus Woesearchaeota archaeon]|nr:30S ribosomal protein S19e [Candidatus Woesearchaeota archaeon]